MRHNNLKKIHINDTNNITFQCGAPNQELIHHENRSSSPYSPEESLIILEDSFKVYSRKDQQFYKCSLKLTPSYLILILNRRQIVTSRKLPNDATKYDSNLTDDYSSGAISLEDSCCISLDHITNAYRRDRPISLHSRHHKHDITSALSTSTCDLIEYEALITRFDKHHGNQLPMPDTCSYLYISVYQTSKLSSRKRPRGKRTKRDTIFDDNYDPSQPRQVYMFAIDTLRLQELNNAVADKWANIILALIQQQEKQVVPDDHCLVSNLRIQNRKRLLIIIDLCAGGKGKSLEIFKKRLMPILFDSQIEFDVMIVANNSCQQLREFLADRSIQPVKWRALIMISGDTLFHHIINAIMSRKDWPLAISVPLAIIPSGRETENALAYSLMNLDECHNVRSNLVEITTKNILRGITNSLDLLRITTNKTNVVWSHLSLTWPFPPKSDLGRKSSASSILEYTRSLVRNLYRATTMTSYPGRLSYRLVPQSDLSVVEGNFFAIIALNAGHLSQKCHDHSTIALIFAMEQDVTDLLQKFRFCNAIESGSFTHLSHIKQLMVNQLILEPFDNQVNVLVDGEILEWEIANGPIQVEIIPGIAKVHYRKK